MKLPGRADRAQEPAAAPAGTTGAGEKRRIRGAIGRRAMKIAVFRRWYIKRTLKFIDKSKEKGRRLPPELAEMGRALSRVPRHERAQVLEQAMANGGGMEPEATSRALRRAVGNQGRQSGRGGGRRRPGMPPGTIQQGRRRPS